jgi:hypothetical protein
MAASRRRAPRGPARGAPRGEVATVGPIARPPIVIPYWAWLVLAMVIAARLYEREKAREAARPPYPNIP